MAFSDKSSLAQFFAGDSIIHIETVTIILVEIWPGDWAISLDLTDEYFPMHVMSFLKYLWFVNDGRLYQLKALPFCPLMAALVFTKVFVAGMAEKVSRWLPRERHFMNEGAALDSGHCG